MLNEIWVIQNDTQKLTGAFTLFEQGFRASVLLPDDYKKINS